MQTNSHNIRDDANVVTTMVNRHHEISREILANRYKRELLILERQEILKKLTGATHADE